MEPFVLDGNRHPSCTVYDLTIVVIGEATSWQEILDDPLLGIQKADH